MHFDVSTNANESMNLPNPGHAKEDPPSGKSVLSRRIALTGGVAMTAAAGGFALGSGGSGSHDEPPHEAGDDEPVAASNQLSPHGQVQQGVVGPSPRQAHATVLVADLSEQSDAADLLDDLGSAISGLAAGEHLNGLDPADLTVTVGIGPGLVAATFGSRTPGSTELPTFAREDITEERRGGDLLLQLCSQDPIVTALAEAQLMARFAERMTLRWSARGFRGRPDHGVGRNLLGFHDGLTVPRSDAELEASVWLSGPSSLAGATLAVVRVMPIEVQAFSAMPLAEQEAAIGRERESGTPLSGGSIDEDVDLHVKLDSGAYAISNDAHARRAHPLPAGAPGLMLRRSYSYYNNTGDQGLVFISFQNDINTFIRTQKRMDEGDALLDHATTTASASFLILPGFDESRGLGSALR